jgi:predicted RNA-binding Zn-ribbon protein involved in translation (DUF1610 family)
MKDENAKKMREATRTLMECCKEIEECDDCPFWKFENKPCKFMDEAEKNLDMKFHHVLCPKCSSSIITRVQELKNGDELHCANCDNFFFRGKQRGEKEKSDETDAPDLLERCQALEKEIKAGDEYIAELEKQVENLEDDLAWIT